MMRRKISWPKKQREIKIKVFRFDPALDEAPRMEEYTVEYHDGMRIWNALDNINEKHRANISWRLSCREYLCGSCTIMINGRPGLACKTAVEDGMVLEPLPLFPVAKDLAVNRDISENRFKKIQPWLKTRRRHFQRSCEASSDRYPHGQGYVSMHRLPCLCKCLPGHKRLMGCVQRAHASDPCRQGRVQSHG